MCGIAGIVGRSDDIIDGDSVDRMCQTIVHRGPDDAGVYARGRVGLALRRLRIIDLSGSKQPIYIEGSGRNEATVHSRPNRPHHLESTITMWQIVSLCFSRVIAVIVGLCLRTDLRWLWLRGDR